MTPNGNEINGGALTSLWNAGMSRFGTAQSTRLTAVVVAPGRIRAERKRLHNDYLSNLAEMAE